MRKTIWTILACLVFLVWATRSPAPYYQTGPQGTGGSTTNIYNITGGSTQQIAIVLAQSGTNANAGDAQGLALTNVGPFSANTGTFTGATTFKSGISVTQGILSDSLTATQDIFWGPSSLSITQLMTNVAQAVTAGATNMLNNGTDCLVLRSNQFWLSYVYTNYLVNSQQPGDTVYGIAKEYNFGPASQYGSGQIVWSNQTQFIGCGQSNTIWNLNNIAASSLQLKQGSGTWFRKLTIVCTNTALGNNLVGGAVWGGLDQVRIICDNTNSGAAALLLQPNGGAPGPYSIIDSKIYSSTHGIVWLGPDCHLYAYNSSVTGTGAAPAAVDEWYGTGAGIATVFGGEYRIVATNMTAATTSAGEVFCGDQPGTTSEVYGAACSATNTTVGGKPALYFYTIASKTSQASSWKFGFCSFDPPLTPNTFTNINGGTLTFAYPPIAVGPNVTVTNWQTSAGQTIYADGGGRSFWGPVPITNAAFVVGSGTVSASGGTLALYTPVITNTVQILGSGLASTPGGTDTINGVVTATNTVTATGGVTVTNSTTLVSLIDGYASLNSDTIINANPGYQEYDFLCTNIVMSTVGQMNMPTTNSLYRMPNKGKGISFFYENWGTNRFTVTSISDSPWVNIWGIGTGCGPGGIDLTNNLDRILMRYVPGPLPDYTGGCSGGNAEGLFYVVEKRPQ